MSLRGKIKFQILKNRRRHATENKLNNTLWTISFVISLFFTVQLTRVGCFQTKVRRSANTFRRTPIKPRATYRRFYHLARSKSCTPLVHHRQYVPGQLLCIRQYRFTAGIIFTIYTIQFINIIHRINTVIRTAFP